MAWAPSLLNTCSSIAPSSLPTDGYQSTGKKAQVNVYNPQGTIDFSTSGREEELQEIEPPPPPTAGRFDIVIDKEIITRLDLSPAHALLRKYVHQIGDNTTQPQHDPKELLERTVGFVIKYERDDPLDPRELSEMPDIRLWFVRLDAAYPWLPAVLDWRGGELARYAAMLVPHQMSKRMGVVFNPEALELFGMKKVFTIHTWLNAQNVLKPAAKTSDMMRMLGFSVGDSLYDLIERDPLP
ncbi:hypothetical protein O6H91_Y229500 [Diphasiastrum complanatum]|nr:hypothetical protein O6H91_Y229500 [Diphasiastrum complanatum]